MCTRATVEPALLTDTWLHHYNQHRPHTAYNNQPPLARLTSEPFSS
ncbi:integrase core domain-containing protein [Micromonospora sp. NPDC005324]